jgi:hypothetical protein
MEEEFENTKGALLNKDSNITYNRVWYVKPFKSQYLDTG